MDSNELSGMIVGPDRYQIMGLEMLKSEYADGTESLVMAVKGRAEETGEEKIHYYMMTTEDWKQFFGMCYLKYID